ncbi:MAG: MCE family protein [Deltaproteobacteria bacterium]|nr:MCE family protein [Deltaproteobacteria bacterium]
MANQKTKFTVGLFVFTGVLTALVAIIWLGTSQFFQQGHFYATYLDESVSGLDKDSPVKYRGVAIGRVQQIDVAADSKLIEIVLRIDSGQKLEMDELVAQLNMAGITGSMFLELDRKEPGELDRSPRVNFPTKYKIIASKPSEISELLGSLDKVLSQIASLDLGEIASKIKDTIDHLNETIDEADIKNISLDVRASMAKASAGLTEVQGTLVKVDKIISQNEASIRKSIENIEKFVATAILFLHSGSDFVVGADNSLKTSLEKFRFAMDDAREFLDKSAVLISGTDTSLAHFDRNQLVIAENLERASENLNRLIELITHQPSQLIFSRPPAARKIKP